jgi:hypothetical protein
MHDTAKATTKDEKGELLVDVDEDKARKRRKQKE